MIDLDSFAARLAAIPGVIGVVLGGSRARGTADEHSDTDLGVYRRGVMDLSALREIAAEWPGSAVTEPGEWGPWVDGGAWLTTPGSKTDLLWRDLDRVVGILTEARRGVVRCEAQVGHPLGFFSYAYLAELATSRVLADPSGALAEVRAELDPYPAELAEAVERTYGFEAKFSVDNAATPAARGDRFAATGFLFRGIGCLVHVLHARKGVWLATEKNAVASAAKLPGMPGDFVERVERILAAADVAAARDLLSECSVA
ncbi:nucleotidyltransferase domain-containing protein [Kutzneria sp. CA-103260]|uniref:nucleotidyltransferase domain-containing protein n=1 Tax=Kutzneria sp. CA-103260 TaxID=2802641 RepID=UPI001BA55AB9|nr:nucleotidyltransferase domain-containing protein [Kutzneria sp. CA-103260]QUQ62788.1 nucleotidyltransferase domain-containing protein [Kutzneria sp. CA-103260]